MTRAEKVAEAQRLRAEGLTYRKIGSLMGVPFTTVSAWLTDPDLAKQRARRERYSQPCIDCGAPTDGSGGYAQQRKRCLACHSAHERAAAYWTSERIVQVIKRWAAETGRAPTAREWLYNHPDWSPSVHTIQRVFGSWNAAVIAAGFTPRGPGDRLHYRNGHTGAAVAA